MKTPLAFLAGAGVGALAMWLAMPKATHSAVPETVARQEATGQGARNGNTPADGSEVLPSETKRPATATDNEDAKILDEDDNSPEMREIREAMAKEFTDRKARRLDERVAALKARLNLDDATAAKVRALLERSKEEEDGLVEAVGDQEWHAVPEPGEVAKDRAALDESIAKLLNPAQTAAYKEFTVEQKENRIEVATGREMTRLQSTLTLTPDQKDKVYQALNEITAREDEDGRQMIDLEKDELKARREARLEAMKPLLTPEQFEAYQRSSMFGFQLHGNIKVPEGNDEGGR